MRKPGRTVMTGATVLTVFAVALFNCGGHIGMRRSVATMHNAETETAAPQSSASTGPQFKYVAVVETEVGRGVQRVRIFE